MKILQIGLEWFPEAGGGLDRCYYNCTRYLPQVGVEVKGLVAGSSQVAKDTQGQVQAFAAADASLFKRWRGMRQSFDQLRSTEDFSLIASHFALYSLPILDLIGDRPLVTHFHGPWALESKAENNQIVAIWFKKIIERIDYQKSTSFIVLSQAFREILHREYQVPLERIHIVPGGVDLEQFNLADSRTEARSKLGWSDDRPILLCVRRLARRMGLENLISAIDKVKKYHPDVLLYIAGRGLLADSLRSQIEELELTDNICLLGYISDEQLPLAYRAADLSVVPTISFEGFGLIVIESLAAGTPVLGTPVGGIPEILQPFSEELLFAGYSAEQLAQGIIEVLSDRVSLPSSEACQAYVKEHYAWSKIARQMKSVYEKNLSV